MKEIKDIEDKKVLKVVQDRQRVRDKKREIRFSEEKKILQTAVQFFIFMMDAFS